MAGATFSRVKTWIAEILTASDLNAEFDNILNNLLPAGIDDQSTNVAAMQATTDPYPGGSEVLATDLAGELQRLRYVIGQLTTTTEWYIFPDLISKTAAYTATLDDRIILCDATSAAFSITLPTAVGNTDKFYYIKKTDVSVNAVTVDGAGTEEIDGSLTFVLNTQYDFVVIVSDGANWNVFTEQVVRPTGSTIQSVWVQDGAIDTGTTPIPSTTIPQITEGDEYMTLAITPTVATNRLVIEVVWHGASSNTNEQIFIALFKDATASALASSFAVKNTAANTRGSGSFRHEIVSGTLSEITFRVRAGTPDAGTTTFNGDGVAGVLQGGVLASSIRITEIQV
jgi:hypothetical protein